MRIQPQTKAMKQIRLDLSDIHVKDYLMGKSWQYKISSQLVISFPGGSDGKDSVAM